MQPTATLLALLATAAGLPATLAAPLLAQAASFAVVIDNRHYTPSAAMPASAVLSNPRPITTTYLMSLASSTKVRVSTLVGNVLSKEGPVPIRVQNTIEKVEAVLVDAASTAGKQNTPPTADIPESLRMESMPGHKVYGNSDVPCIYAQMRRDYNDMMVISLVAVFLLVIVAVELWDSSERTTDIEAAPVGAIKLADEPVSEKQLLSVQASPVILASSQAPVATETQTR